MRLCTFCYRILTSFQLLSFDQQAPGIVVAAYVECTRLFAQSKLELSVPEEARGSNATGSPFAPSSSSEDFRYYAPSDLQWGSNVTTCAHTMHYVCYRAYVDSIHQRERTRARQQTMAPRMINPERNEYLCPLCRGFCNCALPLLPVTPLLRGVET